MGTTPGALRIPDGDQPLHARISQAIAALIFDGSWPVGTNLPSEPALSSELGVSRQTLRHALSSLSEQGLIARRHGAGTRVISRQQPRRFTQTFNSMAEILRYPRNTYRENLKVEVVECTGELQTLLKAPAGSSWTHISALRREEGSRLAVASTDIYILPQYADVIRRRDHAHTMVYEQIEAAFGVTIDRAEVEIFPERMPAAAAALLNVDKESPALVIVRRYFNRNNETFEVTITRHPEKRFVYSMELRHSPKA